MNPEIKPVATVEMEFIRDSTLVTMRYDHPTDEKYNLPVKQSMFSDQQQLMLGSSPSLKAFASP